MPYIIPGTTAIDGSVYAWVKPPDPHAPGARDVLHKVNTLPTEAAGFLCHFFTEASFRFSPFDKKLISLSLKQYCRHVLYSSEIAVVSINLVKVIPFRPYACI